MPEQRKPHILISTAGAVNTGKTTLTAAITKVQALRGLAKQMSVDELDNTPEEKEYGLSMYYRYVQYETKERVYNHVDVPGHPDYIPEMIVGADNADGAILVVSASEDTKSISSEHMNIFGRIIYVPSLVVFLNKIDIITDPELIDVMELEIRDMLESFDFDPETPIIRGSALEALTSDSSNINAPEYQPIIKLLDEADDWLPSSYGESTRPFIMPIGNVKAGTTGEAIVTGHLDDHGGIVQLGDEADIVGLRDIIQTTKVSSIEAFGEPLSSGEQGYPLDITLENIKPEEVKRGMFLTKRGRISTPRRKFKAEVYFLRTSEDGMSESFITGYSPMFHINTFAAKGAITPNSQDTVEPGDNVNITVELKEWAALEKGMKLAIRDNKLIGWGVVTEFVD